MKIIDMSQPVYDAAPNCPGHPPVESTLKAQHPESGGDGTVESWHLELLTMSNHTGSHVDAPLHRIPGASSLSDMPLSTFVGRPVIADMRPLAPKESIRAESLRAVLNGQDLKDAIVLLCTGWGGKRAKTEEWLYNAPVLGADGAEFLVAAGVRAVGIDHYSVGDAETHRILLSQSVWIVEELSFPAEAFEAAPHATFVCLPINLEGHSGAWCRPVLFVNE